jgi:hypothetical protein
MQFSEKTGKLAPSPSSCVQRHPYTTPPPRLTSSPSTAAAKKATAINENPTQKDKISDETTTVQVRPKQADSILHGLKQKIQQILEPTKSSQIGS